MPHRPLAVVTLAALLLCLAPVATATPESTAVGHHLTRISTWFQWLPNAWTSAATNLQAASTEPAPDDPEPLPSDPVLDPSTTDSSGDDGETLPDMDPWG